MKEGTMERRGTTIKKFILVTLTHADRRPTAKKELVRDRLRQLFDCRAVLVAKEPHSEGGYNIRGVFNRNASKHTATKKIRECFTGQSTRCEISQGLGSHMVVSHQRR